MDSELKSRRRNDSTLRRVFGDELPTLPPGMLHEAGEVRNGPTEPIKSGAYEHVGLPALQHGERLLEAVTPSCLAAATDVVEVSGDHPASVSSLGHELVSLGGEPEARITLLAR